MRDGVREADVLDDDLGAHPRRVDEHLVPSAAQPVPHRRIVAEIGPVERGGQLVPGRVRTRTLDHFIGSLQSGHERPPGRERETEIAESAKRVEHGLPRSGSKHRHHLPYERVVDLRVDLDEVERMKGKTNRAVIQPVVQLGPRANERPSAVRASGLQPDPDSMLRRERLDRCEVVRAERIQMTDDECGGAIPRRDLDLRNPRSGVERADERAQRHHERAEGIGEHLAVRDVRNAAGKSLAEPDQSPVPSSHESRAEPRLATISPGRSGQWRHDLLRREDGDIAERPEQGPFLVAQLRLVGQVLKAASAAAVVEPASRLDPIHRRLDDLQHDRFIVAPAPLHAPADDFLARQGAVHERRLAVGAPDAPSLAVEVVDAHGADLRRAGAGLLQHWRRGFTTPPTPRETPQGEREHRLADRLARHRTRARTRPA